MNMSVMIVKELELIERLRDMNLVYSWEKILSCAMH